MREWVKEYLEALGERGCRGSSLKAVSVRLRNFYRYLDSRGIPEINSGVLKQYQEEILAGPFAYGYQRALLEAVRGYFEYLTREKKFLCNPARDLEMPVKRVLPVEIPTAGEIDDMLEEIDTRYEAGKRDKAMLELFYSSGLRAGELLNLDIGDVDFEGGRIRIRDGKGGKDRVVPVGEKALQCLLIYVKKVRPRRAARKNETALFLSEQGNRMRSRMLYWMMNDRRGTRNNISPHKLRHACAVEMLRGGADIRHIQELLGHEWLSTTQIYTQMAPVDLKEAHQKYHPRK